MGVGGVQIEGIDSPGAAAASAAAADERVHNYFETMYLAHIIHMYDDLAGIVALCTERNDW